MPQALRHKYTADQDRHWFPSTANVTAVGLGTETTRVSYCRPTACEPRGVYNSILVTIEHRLELMCESVVHSVYPELSSLSVTRPWADYVTSV